MQEQLLDEAAGELFAMVEQRRFEPSDILELRRAELAAGINGLILDKRKRGDSNQCSRIQSLVLCASNLARCYAFSRQSRLALK